MERLSAEQEMMVALSGGVSREVGRAKSQPGWRRKRNQLCEVCHVAADLVVGCTSGKLHRVIGEHGERREPGC